MTRLLDRLPRGRRAIAWAGVLVGVAAALVALPPFGVRSPVVPTVIGLVALTIGIGSVIRGERRIGAYAIAAGVAGFAIGYLATRSSVDKLDAVVIWGALFLGEPITTGKVLGGAVILVGAALVTGLLPRPAARDMDELQEWKVRPAYTDEEIA